MGPSFFLFFFFLWKARRRGRLYHYPKIRTITQSCRFAAAPAPPKVAITRFYTDGCRNKMIVALHAGAMRWEKTASLGREREAKGGLNGT